MFASIAHNPMASASSVIEDHNENSSWSSLFTSNDDLPNLPLLDMGHDQPRNHAPDVAEAFQAYFNLPLERVQLADGRWIFAKIIGYTCDDAPPPPSIKISKTVLRVGLRSLT
jgi:hypothetical protein